MNKEKFGTFIKNSRIKKGYTQKELADLLFIDVTAVSKWERGITYPDITLVPEICKNLNINEHELILSSNDQEYRKNIEDARKYNKIKNIIFYSTTISYLIAIVTCFVVNLAVSHTLSWFWLVLTSCLTSFTFIPTCTKFFSRGKFSIFIVSTFISLFILYITCSIYVNNYWYLVATFGTLLGYFTIFYPIIFKKQSQYMHEDSYNNLKRFLMITYAFGLLLLTLLLLLFINNYSGISNFSNAITITLYSYVILFIYGIVEIFKINRFIKISLDCFFTGLYFVGLALVLNKIFGESVSTYKINFLDWNNYCNGNVCFIILLSLLVVSIIFGILGIKKNEIATRNK